MPQLPRAGLGWGAESQPKESLSGGQNKDESGQDGHAE